MRSSCVHILAAASLTILLGSPAKGDDTSGSDKLRRMPDIGKGLELRVGESFLKARSRIISRGWKPMRMHKDDNYEYDGAEKRLVARSFLEVDSCSIDAGANCILYYGKGASCLRLDTVGEQVNEMEVTRWTNECPVRK